MEKIILYMVITLKLLDNNWHLNFKGSGTISETDSAIARRIRR